MDPATLLLITQLISLATQAAAQIPAIKNAFTSPSANSTAQQQAEAAAQLQQAHQNLQTTIQHIQAALGAGTAPSS